MKTETTTTEIVGLNALKNEWRRAKLKVGDMRGLGRAQRFELGEKFGITAMQIAFDSIAPKDGKVEIEADITIDDKSHGSAYSLKDLIEEVNDPRYKHCYIEIQLIKVQWNKRGTDADRSRIFPEFIYKQK